jgi:hypothetical protein
MPRILNNDETRPWRLRVWTGLPDVRLLRLFRKWMTEDGPLLQWRSAEDRWDSLIFFFVQGYRLHSVKSLALMGLV